LFVIFVFVFVFVFVFDSQARPRNSLKSLISMWTVWKTTHPETPSASYSLNAPTDHLPLTSLFLALEIAKYAYLGTLADLIEVRVSN